MYNYNQSKVPSVNGHRLIGQRNEGKCYSTTTLRSW